MSGDLTNSAGDLLLTSSTAQAITHTGATGQDLTISSGANVVVEGVTMNTGALSGVSTLAATDDVTLSKNVAAITHSGTTSLTIASTSGTVGIESIVFAGDAVSGVASIGMSGDLTNSAGDVLLTSSTAQAITHTGAVGQDLTISSGGNVVSEGVTMNTGAVSGVTTLDATDDVTLAKNAAAITHSGSTSLTIASTTGTVAVESVVFSAGAISGVTSVTVSSKQVLGSQQAVEADVPATNDPGDGTIAALTIGSTYSQSEVQALRTECEKLRDLAADLRATVNSLLAKLRTHGLIATAA